MDAPLTNETFRTALQMFSEDCSYMSISDMWRKKPEFAELLAWARANQSSSLTILIEEIETCGWQALDLIHELIGQEVLSKTDHYPNTYHVKVLSLYRFALDRGYGSQKIQFAHDILEKRLRVEQKVDRVIRRIDVRRRYQKMKSRDWRQAKAKLIAIAKRETVLFLHHALHDILLRRGFNTSHPDKEVVSLVSDVMSLFARPPKKLAEANTSADIYHAWFQGDPKTAITAVLEN